MLQVKSYWPWIQHSLGAATASLLGERLLVLYMQDQQWVGKVKIIIKNGHSLLKDAFIFQSLICPYFGAKASSLSVEFYIIFLAQKKYTNNESSALFSFVVLFFSLKMIVLVRQSKCSILVNFWGFFFQFYSLSYPYLIQNQNFRISSLLSLS